MLWVRGRSSVVEQGPFKPRLLRTRSIPVFVATKRDTEKGPTVELEASVTDFELSKDHSPSARRWYIGRLGTFTAWLHKEGVTDLESVTAGHVRQYLDHRPNAHRHPPE